MTAARSVPGPAFAADAPAKLNLGLAVTGRRADGFHTLRSVFVRLALADGLEVRRLPDARAGGATGGSASATDLPAMDVPATGAAGDTVRVEGQTGEAWDPADDLVLRAVRALRAHVGRPLPPLAFVLTKRIPVRGGLGGGSSDAATALGLAARAWGLDLPSSEPGAIAPHLGADVPFFVARHEVALVEGIGEAIEPLPAPATPAGVVLVTSPGGPSTAAIFRAHDAAPPPDATARRHVDALVGRLRAGLDGPELAELAPSLREANDLWPAAVRLSPELDRLRDELERALDRPFLLTGSGSTLVGLHASPGEATVAADRLARDRPAVARHATVIATATAPATPAGASPRGGPR